jgi:hypothetical protein
MNLKHIAVLLMLVVLSSCTYNYFGARGQKKFHRHYTRERIQNQVQQLRVLDTAAFRNGGGVYIQEIVAKRNGTGVYGYNRRSSHFGRVQFFLYRNDSVLPLPRENEDTLQQQVAAFLRRNSFSERKINIAAKRVRSVYSILSTDSF